MSQYREREYRRRTNAAGLVSFHVAIKETDLWVSAEMNLEDGLRLETKLMDYLVATEDHKEARDAFLEKRKPNIKGK